MVTQDLAAAVAHGYPDYLYISSSIIMNGLAGDQWDDFDEATDGTWTGDYVMESAGLSMTVDADGLPEATNLMPMINGPAYQGVDDVIEDDFFVQADHKGAFGDVNWLEGWSWLDVSGLLNIEDNIASIISDRITLHGNYPNLLTLAPIYLLTSVRIINLFK